MGLGSVFDTSFPPAWCIFLNALQAEALGEGPAKLGFTTSHLNPFSLIFLGRKFSVTVMR